MGYIKRYKKGGMGGKLGHSNMSHWDTSGIVKEHARKSRRLEERELQENVKKEFFSSEEEGFSHLDDFFDVVRIKSTKSTKKERVAPLSYMKIAEVEEIIQKLPKERILFYYFKGYYSYLLLAFLIDNGLDIRDIKASPFAKLLKVPQIKNIVSKIGNTTITKDHLFAYLPVPEECYLITIGQWGKENERFMSSYYQTSRPGINMVLQLNFSNKHDKSFKKIFGEYEDSLFQFHLHPISQNYNTLAWSRIDISEDRTEALIEEIQNDWIRLVMFEKTTVETITNNDGQVENEVFIRKKTEPEKIQKYIKTSLKPHFDLWEEAIMSATIWFLAEVVGVKNIYFHTYEGGNILKNIQSHIKPPLSIYSKLPKKFCFQQTSKYPGFLETKIRYVTNQHPKVDIGFYLLEL